MWVQREISISPKTRGFHLITLELIDSVEEIKLIKTGLCHIFIQHTSASLTINENADPDVRHDLDAILNKLIPPNEPYFRHTTEGSDDMPAHIKASLLGNNLIIPITEGRLNLGIWQGIYLGEHRNHGGARTLLITLTGEKY